MPKRPSLAEVMERGSQESQPVVEPRPRGRPKKADSLTSRLERGDYKQLKALIPSELHRKVKATAALQDREISDLVMEALQGYLKNTKT